MKRETVEVIVQEFAKAKVELLPLIEAIGYKALTAIVRQKGIVEDTVWACQEIGFLPNADAFYGKFFEKRPPGDQLKQVRVFLDLETIKSIEFEIFDDDPPGTDDDQGPDQGPDYRDHGDAYREPS